jgi:hypothetical protein
MNLFYLALERDCEVMCGVLVKEVTDTATWEQSKTRVVTSQCGI